MIGISKFDYNLRTYKLLIDVLPRGTLLLIFFFLMISCGVSIAVVVFAPQMKLIHIERKLKIDEPGKSENYLVKFFFFK